MLVHVVVALVGLGLGFIGGFLIRGSVGEAPRTASQPTPTLTLRSVRYRPAVLQSIAEN